MTEREPKTQRRRQGGDRADVRAHEAASVLVTPRSDATSARGEGPIRLDAQQRRVLDEALRLGADVADEIESRVSAYGRWLLEKVFENDAAAALSGTNKSPVWLELVRRSGGPTLRVSRRMLYVALQIAAYDRRISDQSWRRLDVGRKEILLPLDEDKKLREAAQHVSRFNLTHRKTREYVTVLLAKGGRPKQVRLTAPSLSKRVRQLREGLGSKDVLRRIREQRAEWKGPERENAAVEIEKLREVLKLVVRELRGR